MTIWTPALAGQAGARYRAIAEALAADIRSGRLRRGDRLPTHRALAYRLGVTVGTVSRAYAEAERRGLISGEVGRGTYVRGREAAPPVFTQIDHREPAAEGDRPIDLSLNFPAPLAEAEALLAAALTGLARHPGIGGLLDYHPHAGSRRLREAGAAWLARAGLAADPEQVIVTAGAQHAMTAAFAALTRPGDLVLTEGLTYPGMKTLAAMLHLRLQGLATDQHGILPDGFAAACRSLRPRALYCMPNLQNPTGTLMPEERRREIVAIARAHEVALVEDDIYGFLIGDAPPPLAALAPDIGHYVTSLSKCVAPGLRIGFLAVPAGQQALFAAPVRTTCWMAAPLTAEIALGWIGDGTADRLAAERRSECLARQRIAREMLPGSGYSAHPAGFHGWLDLPVPWRSEDFVAQARRRGVLVTPAEAFVVSRPARQGVRLCIGAARTRAELRQALGLVADLLREPPEIHLSVV